MQLTFTGTPQDALVVKEFLAAQFRSASEKDLKTTYTLTFAPGLVLDAGEPEKLVEKLARFAAGPVVARAVLVRGDGGC